MRLVLPLIPVRILKVLLMSMVVVGVAAGQQTSNTVVDDTTPVAGQMMQQLSAQPSSSRGIVLQDNQLNGATLPDCQSLGPGQSGANCVSGQGAQGTVGGSVRQTTASAFPSYPATEFQRVVRDTVGHSLTIYGESLFSNAPSTFAPVDRVPVTPDYVIGPGDELLVQAWGQVTLNGHYTVDRTGNVYIPQVGPVHVAGLPFAEVQSFVKSQMGRVFRNFDLNVNMGQLRSIQIFVVGQARRPGSYTVSSLSTLVNALFATGGPTPQGSMRHIQLKRGDKVVTEFDLYDLLLRGDKSKDVPLQPGDVIYIPEVGEQVAVAGSVNTPAIYELNTGATVADAVQLAGGLTNVALTQQLRIERISDRTSRSVLEFVWSDAGKATVLRDGDILEFPTITDQFQNAVTLRGNVANPGRYVWHAGMRVRDLIPSRESLITRDYWQRRAKLGQTTLNYVPLPEATRTATKPIAAQNGTALSSGTQLHGDQALQATTRAGTAADSVGAQTAVESSAMSVDGIPFQTPVDTSSQMDTNNAAAGNGSTARAESGSASTLFAAKTYVVSSGPDINWSYAVIDRQNKKDLTTSLIPFNLGAVVLNGDESQNYELQPEDVVTIFSKADLLVPQSQQTRYVRLEGEFVSAGVYTVRPGETLRKLVERAGGLTQDAYLYGSDFTRESTRRAQQQRLKDYANQLEQQASSSLLNAAGSSVSTQDSAAATAAQQQAQQLVTRLRQVQATGRIVLDLPVDSHGTAALPDIPLEDGDRFLVPRVPSTVAVEGAVYNANAFLYSPGQRVGRYVKLAGGTNRDADRGRQFVVRADGSVVSRQYSSKLRGDNFDSVRLYPGDTVVVPQNINKGSGLRLLVDIATIVGQFGLAIAAINLVL